MGYRQCDNVYNVNNMGGAAAIPQTWVGLSIGIVFLLSFVTEFQTGRARCNCSTGGGITILVLLARTCARHGILCNRQGSLRECSSTRVPYRCELVGMSFCEMHARVFFYVFIVLNWGSVAKPARVQINLVVVKVTCVLWLG